jgi:protein-disulfide isomerase
MIRTLIAPLVLATGLAAAPLAALDLSSMSEAERSAFRDEIRSYLLDNPEIILEAIQVLEDRQAAAQAEADRATLAANLAEVQDDGYSWVGGNPEGDITLVEFIDYRCGFCRRAAPEVDALLENDGNIRLVIKEFPILGEDSLASSRFAVATKQVAGNEAYKQVHDALLALSGAVNETALRRLSDGLGLQTDAIIAQMDSDEVTAEIAQTRDLAQRLGISGTPTFVLEDEMLRGFVPADELAVIVADKRG